MFLDNLADPLGQLPTMEPNLNSNKRAAPDGNDDADNNNNNNNNNNNKRSRTNRIDLRFLLASRKMIVLFARKMNSNGDIFRRRWCNNWQTGKEHSDVTIQI